MSYTFRHKRSDRSGLANHQSFQPHMERAMSQAQACRRCLSMSILLAILSIQAPSIASSFYRIGNFEDGTRATVSGMSGDGTIIVGFQWRPDDLRSWSWTADEGFEEILPPGEDNFWVTNISADGSVVVGATRESSGPNDVINRPYKWSSDDGFQLLEFPQGVHRGAPLAVSGDGAVIGGSIYEGEDEQRGIVWTEAGMTIFKEVPSESRVEAISDDGTTVAIQRRGRDASVHVWNESAGLVETDLHTLRSSSSISADGSVVVGIATIGNNQTAARWSAETGVVSLGGASGGLNFSRPRGVSASGAVVVGGLGDLHANTRGAFIWDAFHGMRRLKTVLEDEFGMTDLHPWRLGHAIDISDDLRTIVGLSSRGSESEAWAVRLDRPIGAIPGDTDLDFDVDFADFVTLSLNYGETGEWEDGDFDSSGTVEFVDFVLQSNNFGVDALAALSAPAKAIPEPSSIALALLAMPLLLNSYRERNSSRVL